MSRCAFGLLEPGIQKRRAEFVPFNCGDMLSPNFRRHLCCSFLVAEQQYLTSRREPRPAPDSIPLNDAEMPFEGLGNSEDRQHAGPSDFFDTPRSPREPTPP